MSSKLDGKLDGVVGVIRTNDPDVAYRLAKAWNPTSITSIEITMTVPSALSIIEKLLGEGVTRLGGGTVRTVEEVRKLAKMGAAFAVSPHSDEKVIKEAVDLGLPVTPGAMTPTEIVKVMQWGATAAKIFPIKTLGGLSYIEAILEPLPDLKLVVSGGVQPHEVQSYLKTGCVGVCMGGALWSEELAASDDIKAITEYANRALEKM
jgi:2-dehydro-3-deoxyphosphogluconate aldolase / (4S)-4-hydroxy-2-oxoglutarate aldolase